jgi:hypothetical protein
MTSQNVKVGGKYTMKEAPIVSVFDMPFCRMEEADVGFSYIVQTHSCGV